MNYNNFDLKQNDVCENCGHKLSYGITEDHKINDKLYQCPKCYHTNNIYVYCSDCDEPLTENDYHNYYVGSGFCKECFIVFFTDFDLVIKSDIIDGLEEI
jgi:hypothetical protein